MRSLKLTLAYDGSAYVGWQAQAEGATVQEAIEATWAKITGERLRIVGRS